MVSYILRNQFTFNVKNVWPWKYYTNLFKVGLTDQLDDHFDIIPLQTGPSKGKIVDSSVEDNWLLGGMIVDSLGNWLLTPWGIDCWLLGVDCWHLGTSSLLFLKSKYYVAHCLDKTKYLSNSRNKSTDQRSALSSKNLTNNLPQAVPYPENGQLVTKAFISGRRDSPHFIYRFLLHASIENKTRTHDSIKNKTST